MHNLAPGIDATIPCDSNPYSVGVLAVSKLFPEETNVNLSLKFSIPQNNLIHKSISDVYLNLYMVWVSKILHEKNINRCLVYNQRATISPSSKSLNLSTSWKYLNNAYKTSKFSFGSWDRVCLTFGTEEAWSLESVKVMSSFASSSGITVTRKILKSGHLSNDSCRVEPKYLGVASNCWNDISLGCNDGVGTDPMETIVPEYGIALNSSRSAGGCEAGMTESLFPRLRLNHLLLLSDIAGEGRTVSV
ncbi:hypothetical protein OGAPHI_005296 [Ogataea philodendri]|uniref:Uncharacterized protein n=1 Tax=Ogataea philodendri TaxID=1378263 RepID=A0A9P8T302_9ASCO|nr:uncharacterized protein OGAPHI_005296 [Ogataea philodendri]KAH3663306.1 hypothetical protein OGAPHI_005296 [Ogataea philodendri]